MDTRGAGVRPSPGLRPALKKLVILHIDGLSAAMLQRAVDAGRMPFVRQLLDREGYELHRYRCGVPSTTPFAQAGILYGDNSEIPSFRWWDRERRLLVKFGAGSTFKMVADKYFRNSRPLTQGGACIAACYSAGAAETFGISYQDRAYRPRDRSRSALAVLLPYLANPVHVGDWLWQTVHVLGRTARDYGIALRQGRRPAGRYVVTDVVEESFVHHLTRYAVQKAMRADYSPIYAGFYAFDETAHAFGPDDPSAQRILAHVDHTISKVAGACGERYEMVVLSDHGQVETAPFALGRALGKMFPNRLIVTASGGLAHVYLAGSERRLSYSEVVAQSPALIDTLRRMDEVALVMARDGDKDVFLDRGRGLDFYDEPDILRAQLARLNSFENSGDLVLFGAFRDGRQVNFENQAGGHGSIGGEQLHPFMLARRKWGLDTSHVTGAHQIHPILSELRDALST